MTSQPRNQPPADETEQMLYFVFCDGNATFAVPPESVVEVVAGSRATPVPFTPEWIEGVVSVRGEIVPVLDLQKYFQLPSESESARGRLILFGVGGTSFTLWSDRILGIETVDRSRLEAPLASLPQALLGCTRAQFRLEGTLVYAIDLLKLIEESRGQVRRR